MDRMPDHEKIITRNPDHEKILITRNPDHEKSEKSAHPRLESQLWLYLNVHVLVSRWLLWQLSGVIHATPGKRFRFLSDKITNIQQFLRALNVVIKRVETGGLVCRSWSCVGRLRVFERVWIDRQCGIPIVDASSMVTAGRLEGLSHTLSSVDPFIQVEWSCRMSIKSSSSGGDSSTSRLTAIRDDSC